MNGLVMQPRLKMSREGLELLKSFEGLRLTAAHLPDGRWTMGHGHTQYAREGATISPADAEALLLYDLIPVVAAVNDAVTVDISQNQFDALVCFAFNVGVESFQSSEVLTRVNQERMTEAALAMAIWRAGAFDGRRIVLDALVRRRSAEEALMLGTSVQPTPSDLVRPEVDPVAEAALPDSRPADLDVDFTAEAATAEVSEYEREAAPASVVEQPANESVEAEPVVEEEPIVVEAACQDEAPAVDSVEADVVQPTFEEPAADEPASVDRPEAAVAPALVEIVHAEAPADFEAASAEAVAELDPAPAVPEALMTPAPPAPSPTINETSVSTRIYATYPTETFAPVHAAEVPQDEILPLDIGGDADPAVTSDAAEPPLVLVLTPPPEVAELAPARQLSDVIIEASVEGQAALFEAEPSAAAPDDSGVIFYEPASPEDRSSRWSDATAYFATGAVGLAAFGFGVAGFHLANENPVPNGVFDEKSAIAWVLVIIGAICVGISAYNLFKRLGMDDAEVGSPGTELEFAL